jgi:hypothetical protein
VTADAKRLPKAERKHRRTRTPDGQLDFLCVRARKADHLRDLFPGYTVYEWPGRDYPARIFIDRADFTEFLTRLAATVTYDNFKSSVADNELHDAYMGIWSVMHGYQGGRYRRAPYDPRQNSFYDRFTGPPGEPLDMDDAGQPVDWDDVFDDTGMVRPGDDEDEPCTTPGCTDLNPCLDCIIDATSERPYGGAQGTALEAELQTDRELYGDFDSGDEADDDDGAESHHRVPPRG